MEIALRVFLVVLWR